MSKVTESQMKDFILNKLPFRGSSVTGILEDGAYSVLSYSKLIYRDKDNYFDNQKYSATTSKIQNILISVYGFNNGVQKRN